MTEMPLEAQDTPEQVESPTGQEKSFPSPVHTTDEAILCRLPHCDKTFIPNIHNQGFCCAEHQTQFWTLARKYGKVLLDEMRKDKEIYMAEWNERWSKPLK